MSYIIQNLHWYNHKLYILKSPYILSMKPYNTHDCYLSNIYYYYLYYIPIIMNYLSLIYVHIFTSKQINYTGYIAFSDLLYIFNNHYNIVLHKIVIHSSNKRFIHCNMVLIILLWSVQLLDNLILPNIPLLKCLL